VGAVVLLAFSAACSSAEEPAPGEKVIVPSEDVFEFAPDGAEVAVDKAVQEHGLEAKGSESRPFGTTFVQPVTIAPNQNVSYSTSGGSVGVDPVLVLFHRHDNSTEFSAFPYTQRVGIQTLAINDDTNGLHSSISYTNNTNITLNAYVMVFAWAGAIGQVELSGVGLVNASAGSVKTSGTAGVASTSGSTAFGGGTPDPWLFIFDATPGQGNGAWNDDSNGTRESTITGASSSFMWYVAHGFNSGTTTINF
jgi:hypothetical protein